MNGPRSSERSTESVRHRSRVAAVHCRQGNDGTAAGDDEIVGGLITPCPCRRATGMPLLSIVTAALAPTQAHLDFLLEAYESLTQQVDLGGWEWEWLIQEDGERPRLRAHLPADARISYGAHRRQ